VNIAAIDAGTNTLRLLIVRVGERKITTLLRKRIITGLGSKMSETGLLGENGSSSTIKGFSLFSREMGRKNVSRYHAVGTQAFREGGNAGELVGRIEEESGLRVTIIDTREEAELTRRGITSAIGKGILTNSVIVDIGGGSTEFIRSVRGNTRIIATRLGVIRLDDLFPLKDPPRGWELNNLRLYLRDRIERVREALGVKRTSRIVGTAGTYTTLASVHKRMRRYVPEDINGTSLNMNVMKTLVPSLLSMSSRSRLRLPGMEKGRERLIVPGSLIALESMHIFRAKEILVSDGSLLEGIIGEMVENESKGENYVVQ